MLIRITIKMKTDFGVALEFYGAIHDKKFLIENKIYGSRTL